MILLKDESAIGKDFTSGFGILLITPDDMGYSIKLGKEKGEPRARKNVILETGMLLSSLTRERIKPYRNYCQEKTP